MKVTKQTCLVSSKLDNMSLKIFEENILDLFKMYIYRVPHMRVLLAGLSMIINIYIYIYAV